MKGRIFIIGCLSSLVLIAAMAALGAALALNNTVHPLPPLIEVAQKGSKCIADNDYMRRHHMEMLIHQRQDTVHLGIRSTPVKLRGCINCHASAKTGSVARAPTDFCVSCHTYAAVKIDCFDCHASTPDAITASSPMKKVPL